MALTMSSVDLLDLEAETLTFPAATRSATSLLVNPWLPGSVLLAGGAACVMSLFLPHVRLQRLGHASVCGVSEVGHGSEIAG